MDDIKFGAVSSSPQQARDALPMAASRDAGTVVSGDGRASSPLGLSKLHTSPRGVRLPVAAVAMGGNLVELRGGRVSQGGIVRPAAKRGQVRGFSRGSRRRLLKLLASLNKGAIASLPLFVTLTYPTVWSPDPSVWKRDLDAFCKRLRRAFPGVSAVWKLEPQRRGAPHFHLLIFGVERIDKVWLSRAWYEVVGSGDPKHLQAGTSVERVKSWRGVMAYAAKYMGKVEQSAEFPEYVGRWWGVIGRELLPVLWYAERLGFGAFYVIRRILRRYLRSRGVRLRCGLFSGISVFLDADVGFRLLDIYGGL